MVGYPDSFHWSIPTLYTFVSDQDPLSHLALWILMDRRILLKKSPDPDPYYHVKIMIRIKINLEAGIFMQMIYSFLVLFVIKIFILG